MIVLAALLSWSYCFFSIVALWFFFFRQGRVDALGSSSSSSIRFEPLEQRTICWPIAIGIID